MKKTEWNSKEKFDERKSRVERIAEQILYYDADIVVLQEFEISEIGRNLIDLINNKYKVHYEKINNASVVLIAFKEWFLSNKTCKSQKGNLKAYARWNEINFELVNGKELKVIGIHVPLSVKDDKRGEFKRELDNVTNQMPVVIIGDFNAATNDDRAVRKEDNLKENIEFLYKLNNKFIDAWREKSPLPSKEYTWFYEQNDKDGRRLDYAFLSENIELECVKHYSKVNTALQEDGLSDHSALLVELK